METYGNYLVCFGIKNPVSEDLWILINIYSPKLECAFKILLTQIPSKKMSHSARN